MLRGDGSNISWNFSEVLLIDNHKRTKRKYEELGLSDNEMAVKHLESQLLTIHLLCIGQEIEIENRSGSLKVGYEFIPMLSNSLNFYYCVGLADRIFVLEFDDVRYLLEHQYYNNVDCKRISRVNFLQLLKNEVKLSIMNRCVGIESNKIEYIENWVYSQVAHLSGKERKEFLAFPMEFGYDNDGRTEDGSELEYDDKIESINKDINSNDKSHCNSLNVNESSIEEQESTVKIIENQNDLVSGESFHEYDESKVGHRENENEGDKENMTKSFFNSNEPKQFKTLLSMEQLTAYFDLLNKKHPINERPLLNKEAIDWMVGYYFGNREKYSLNNKPIFQVNLSRLEIMKFLYEYSTRLSPGGKSDQSTPLRQIVTILPDCFSEICSGTAQSYADSISRVVNGFESEITKLFITPRK